MSQDMFSQTVLQFLGPVQDFLLDEGVSEIMINGPREIYIEQRGRLVLTDRHFSSSESLLAAIRNVGQFVGRTIDETKPYMDARLPDGSRVHAMIPPIARRGPYMAIRRFSKNMLTVDDLIEKGSLTAEAALFLKACVRIKKNVVVSGGTGSGKTTLLNIISEFVPGHERIIVIEDASELQLRQAHVLPMETQKADKKGRTEVGIRELVACSLRLRPDRIIVGECRGGEALDMLQAMNTGHSGSMTTLHANSSRDALSRLETMAMMSGVNMPLNAVRGQVASAIDIIVQISRFPDGSRRMTEITEVLELDSEGRYQSAPLFVFNLQGKDDENRIVGNMRSTGSKPTFVKELQLCDVELPQGIFDGL
ncbi:MAG: CpaF family protein [Deltaproteobacteria bacterium]|nr:CpaF family protein [Deltaproteobacteria bacterium]